MKQLPQCCCLFKGDIKYLDFFWFVYNGSVFFLCFIFIDFTPRSSHGPFSYQRPLTLCNPKTGHLASYQSHPVVKSLLSFLPLDKDILFLFIFVQGAILSK